MDLGLNLPAIPRQKYSKILQMWLRSQTNNPCRPGIGWIALATATPGDVYCATNFRARFTFSAIKNRFEQRKSSSRAIVSIVWHPMKAPKTAQFHPIDFESTVSSEGENQLSQSVLSENCSRTKKKHFSNLFCADSSDNGEMTQHTAQHNSIHEISLPVRGREKSFEGQRRRGWEEKFPGVFAACACVAYFIT